MALGTDDSQTACGLHLGRQLDIGTTTGHVGGNGDGSKPIGRLSGQCHNVGLLMVELGVQHLMRNALTDACLGIYVHVEHT